MSSIRLLPCLLLLASGAACQALPVVPVRPPPGLIVTALQAPLTTNFENVSVGDKEGSASAFYLREPFFGLSVSWGDASIKAAASNGYLKTVSYCDYDVTQVLGLFGLFTVTAHGE